MELDTIINQARRDALEDERARLRPLLETWRARVAHGELTPGERNAYEEACVDCAGELEALLEAPVSATTTPDR